MFSEQRGLASLNFQDIISQKLYDFVYFQLDKTGDETCSCVPGCSVLDLRPIGRGFNSQPWRGPVISEIDDSISRVNYLGMWQPPRSTQPCIARGSPYCLVTEAHRCERHAQCCYLAFSRWELNPRKSNALLLLHCATALPDLNRIPH